MLAERGDDASQEKAMPIQRLRERTSDERVRVRLSIGDGFRFGLGLILASIIATILYVVAVAFGLTALVVATQPRQPPTSTAPR